MPETRAAEEQHEVPLEDEGEFPALARALLGTPTEVVQRVNLGPREDVALQLETPHVVAVVLTRRSESGWSAAQVAPTWGNPGRHLAAVREATVDEHGAVVEDRSTVVVALRRH